MLKRILQINKNPLSKICLQKKKYGALNDIGNKSFVWEDQYELIGVIQNAKEERKPRGNEGEYNSGNFVGIFTNFRIDDTLNYRIKRTWLYSTPIIEFYDITNDNQNLYLHNKRHHSLINLRLIND